MSDAYGLTESERHNLIPLLPRRTQVMQDFLAQQAAQGTRPWARLWQEGHGDAWQADTSYITQRAGRWRQALLE